MHNQQHIANYSPLVASCNVSRTPSIPRVQSEPHFVSPVRFGSVPHSLSGGHASRDASNHQTPTLNISDELQPLQPLRKRVMTVPTNLSEYHHPYIVLELLLNSPMECRMGIGDHLRPMIDEAIAEQSRLEHQISVIMEDTHKRIQHTQLQLKQSISASNVMQPATVNEHKRRDRRSDIDSLFPAAPLAIPPTASVHHNNNNDELGGFPSLPDPIHSAHAHHVATRPSIAQFEGVLHKGYGYTTHLMIAVGQASLGAFLSGYNTSVLNVPSTVIHNECRLNMMEYSSLQSFYCLGGLVGALLIGKFADKFGRKSAIIVFDIIFIISGLLTFGFAQGIFGDKQRLFLIFAVARGLCGIGAGMATAIIPTYLGEISPLLIRGAIGTMYQMTVCIGLVFAEILGYNAVLGSTQRWPYLFALNVLFPALQMVTLGSLPESPKWLLTKQDEKEARKVLQYLRECTNVDMDVNFTKLAIANQCKQQQQEKKRTLSDPTTTRYGSANINTAHVHNTDTSASLFCCCFVVYSHSLQRQSNFKVLRCAIAIAVGLQVLQQLSGINSVFYYSNATLMNAGLTTEFELWIGNVLIAFSNFVSVLIPFYFLDKWGRKTLLYISLTGMIVASIAFSICLMVEKRLGESLVIGYVCVVCLVAYVVSFEIGLGPIPWLIMAEITPSSHRAMIVSVATFFNWASNLFIAQFANQIIYYLQFVPFAVVCFVGCMFANKCLPETKGKTEIEIQKQLIAL